MTERKVEDRLMSARNLRKASTFCVLAVAAGYFHSRHSSTCRGSLPNLAFRSRQGRAESTAMNAGFMDIFKGAVGTKGTWSAEEFQRMVKAIESSAQTTIDIVPNWDDLEVILRGQETAAERAKEDLYLAGEAAECLDYSLFSVSSLLVIITTGHFILICKESSADDLYNICYFNF